MSMVYITSDWHLGHTNAVKFSGGFSSQEERERVIIENYRSIVKKRDIVWFLGDIAFTMKDLETLEQLPGEKRLVLGNHDTDRCGRTEKLSMWELAPVFESIHGMVHYKNCWLTHSPIHPCELRGRRNIHGHVHEHSVRHEILTEEGYKQPLDYRYYNACLEVNDFKPVLFQEIVGGKSWKSHGS